MPKKMTKDVAIIFLIKHWEDLTPAQMRHKTGWSEHTILKWSKELRKHGCKLKDKRNKKVDWKKFIEIDNELNRTKNPNGPSR